MYAIKGVQGLPFLRTGNQTARKHGEFNSLHKYRKGVILMKDLQKKIISLIVASFLSFTVLAPVTPSFAAVHTEVTLANEQEDIAKIQSAIERTSAYILAEGVGSEWEAIGLAKAGKKVPAYYETTYNDHLQDQVTSKSGKGRMKITDVERLLLAAIAIGKDPTNVDGKGFNLVEKIYNSEPWATGADSMTFQGNNGLIFALIALDAKAFDVPRNAKWTRDKLINELLKYQREDGAWSLLTATDGDASFDITAMALTALAPYSEQPKVNKAIEKAVAFLSKAQGATGGFNEAFVGGVSSEATAQVIIGLTANGIDPRSTKFTKEGSHLVDHLLSFQSKDGGFKHTIEDRASNNMATEQALQALAAFDLYLNDGGRLYDFTNDVTDLPTGEFTDTAGHWAKEEIQKAVQLGIMNGYSDGSFKPENELTRAQAASIVVRALNLKTNKTAPFTDIKGYAKDTQTEIAAAYHNGLIQGYSDGTFKPGNKVTRAQLSLMLYRAYAVQTGGKYAPSTVAPFTDIASYNSETKEAISMLYELEIIIGSNGRFMPGNPTKRSHASKMLVNYVAELTK